MLSRSHPTYNSWQRSSRSGSGRGESCCFISERQPRVTRWVSEQHGHTKVLGASRRAGGQPGCQVTLFSSPSPPSTLPPDQQLPRLLFVHLPATLAAPCCTALPPALAAAHPSPQPWLWPNWALQAPCIAAFPSKEGWDALGGVSHCSPLPAAFARGQPCPSPGLRCLRGIPTPHPSSVMFPSCR